MRREALEIEGRGKTNLKWYGELERWFPFQVLAINRVFIIKQQSMSQFIYVRARQLLEIYLGTRVKWFSLSCPRRFFNLSPSSRRLVVEKIPRDEILICLFRFVPDLCVLKCIEFVEFSLRSSEDDYSSTHWFNFRCPRVWKTSQIYVYADV